MPNDHDTQYRLLYSELNRHMASQDRRLGNAESRANTLIASSAIFAGLLVVAPLSYGILIALVLNIAAAGLGIATIYPRSVEELNPVIIREQVLVPSADAAQIYLSNQYIGLIAKREAWISDRLRIVKAGLGFLGASLVTAVVAISRSYGWG